MHVRLVFKYLVEMDLAVNNSINLYKGIVATTKRS